MLLVDSKARDTDLNKAVHELKKEADADKLVRAAIDAAAMNPAEKTIHVFVACGGDSTVNAGPHDFAAFLQLPLNPTEALDIAANADSLKQPIDVGLINKSQVFLNMVLSGFPAELGPNSDSAAVPDKIYPALATIITPTTENGSAGRCEHASQERNGALAILAVGNGASLNDGLLEVLYAMDLTSEQAALLAQGLATGSQPAALQQEMHSMHVPWLEVHAPGGLQTLYEEDVRFEVLHHRLHLALPGGSFGAGTPSRRDLISQARMTKHARSISDTSRGSEGSHECCTSAHHPWQYMTRSAL
ncbi:g11692 [Coccomyxa elongata]